MLELSQWSPQRSKEICCRGKCVISELSQWGPTEKHGNMQSRSKCFILELSQWGALSSKTNRRIAAQSVEHMESEHEPAQPDGPPGGAGGSSDQLV